VQRGKCYSFDAWRDQSSRKVNCCNQAISLIDPTGATPGDMMSEMAIFRQLLKELNFGFKLRLCAPYFSEC